MLESELEVREIPTSLIIGTLSRALDLTEGEPLGHSLRCCYIGMRLAAAIGLDQAARSDLFYALLLKDAGCSANAYQVSHWFGTDDHRAKRDLKIVNWSRLVDAVRYALTQATSEGPWAQQVLRMIGLARRGPRAARELVQMRCTRGADLVRQMGWANLVPDAVLNLDEHWDGSGYPMGVRGNEIPILARIMLLI